jgi:hypothetical protein
MYGKRRVVLSSKFTRSGNRVVSISGGKSHVPLGLWYEIDGLFYADLKSGEQLYQLVSNDAIATKRFGGVPTQKALREAVMSYYSQIRSAA